MSITRQHGRDQLPVCVEKTMKNAFKDALGGASANRFVAGACQQLTELLAGAGYPTGCSRR